jgi:hypothetical protein
MTGKLLGLFQQLTVTYVPLQSVLPFCSHVFSLHTTLNVAYSPIGDSSFSGDG